MVDRESLLGPIRRRLHLPMLIKICGITNIDDGRFALDAGADWIGLNLVGGPRRIDLPALERITGRLDDVSPVVALVRLSGGRVEPALLIALGGCGVSRLQLYGDVVPGTFEQLASDGFVSIFVQSVSGVESLNSLGAFLDTCKGEKPDHIILDAGMPDQLGGTGRRLDWELLAAERSNGRFEDWPPILLAGGLEPGNVVEAIRLTTPSGVDVASGVESSLGKKSHRNVEAFIRAALNASTK